jgi:hypothetical protein
MISQTHVRLLGAFLLGPLVIGWGGSGGANHDLTLESRSRLWVAGTSTVRSFECSATAFQADVAATSPRAASAVPAGEKDITKVAVSIPARRLDCANGTMNDHMYKALNAAQHELITFRLASYDLVTAGDAATGRINGALAIGGATRSVTIDASARDAGNGVLRVTGAHEIRMSDFGLRAPTLMLGTLRVHDRVEVNFDLYLRE